MQNTMYQQAVGSSRCKALFKRRTLRISWTSNGTVCSSWWTSMFNDTWASRIAADGVATYHDQWLIAVFHDVSIRKIYLCRNLGDTYNSSFVFMRTDVTATNNTVYWIRRDALIVSYWEILSILKQYTTMVRSPFLRENHHGKSLVSKTKLVVQKLERQPRLVHRQWENTCTWFQRESSRHIVLSSQSEQASSRTTFWSYRKGVFHFRFFMNVIA